MWLLLCVFGFLFVVYLFRSQDAGRRATIVVLGDIGRSPRMQYHAISFTKEGFDVDFVGYGGSTPHSSVMQNKKIHIYHLKEPPAFVNRLPRLIVYGIKVVWRSAVLLFTLMLVKKPSFLLLQNPPAIPTLAICGAVSLMRGSKYIIDWHNYGYTILGLTLGKYHPLVILSRWYEKFFARFSHGNICVTHSMREDLKKNWNVTAVTMYDRPSSLFRKSDLNTQHHIFSKLAEQYSMFRPSNTEDHNDATVFTKAQFDGEVVMCENRPALLISSTSWTEDEDFSLLLNALEKYEEMKQEGANLPDLVCVITGKGPQKSHYIELINKKYWEHVSVCTPWLEAEDYPKLLGSADLGVCLHKSSSGLDLPMKIVDMFGCGLPVCAVYYKCLEELVRDKQNGLMFNTSDELAAHLETLFTNFPKDCSKLAKMSEQLKVFQKLRWDQQWQQCVVPLLC